MPTPATPTASAAVLPGVTPSPEEAAVIAAFISNFGQEQPPFHLVSDVRMTGSAGGETKKIAMSISGDIDGQDFSGEISLSTAGSARIRFVDGVAYVRPPGQGWKIGEDFNQAQPLNPFSLLDAADLTYVGKAPARHGAHQLRTTEWIGGELKAAGLRNIELLSSVFDIYVDKDGIPVEAVLDFAIAARLPTADAHLDYHVVYRFSDVGDPVEIRAPI
jgi:hypothetical protein